MYNPGKIGISQLLQRAILPSVLLGSFCLFAQEVPNNIALIVAVSDYPEHSGWQKLSAHNDLELVRETLVAQGFAEDVIHTLQDADATRTGILKAIREELLEKAEPGSVAYFHFSGHGQQVMDDDGDEIDGYDEAIVPVNSPQAYRPGIYEGENLVRDEELGELFNEIREKIGPEGVLQVVLDACHSGTGTRGLAVARGTQVKMAPEGFRPDSEQKLTDRSQFSETDGTGQNGLAPMIAFFGSAHNQLNFETTDEEGRSMGSLTYAFCKSLARAKGHTSYRGLFEKIRLEMNAIAPMQQPQAEGDLDVEVMSGRYAGASEYIRVRQWNDPGSVVIDAGRLHGIYEGSEVGLYPPDTRAPYDTEPIAKGTVVSALPASSILELDRDLSQEKAVSAWAYVTTQAFGSPDIGVSVQVDPDQALHGALLKKLGEKNIAVSDASPDLFVRKGASGDIELVTPNDHVVGTYESPSASAIVEDIMRYGHVAYLKRLELSSLALPVDFEIVPVEYDPDTYSVTRELPPESRRDSEGRMFLREGDVIVIRIHNRGSRPAYVSLLDFQPDYKINVLCPGPTETPDEYLVPPGRTLQLPSLIEIWPPYGTEVFQLIATDRPIDLRPLGQSRGTRKKGGTSTVEELFVPEYFNDKIRTRGGRPKPAGAAEVNIRSILFDIIPKE